MRSDDNEDSLCIWDHCIKGMEHRTHKTSSKTKNSLDLRSHMAPKAAVDVYKVKNFQCNDIIFLKIFRSNLVKALGPDQRKKIHSTFHNDFINDANCHILTGPTLSIFIKQNCCQDFYFNKICSSNQVFKTSMQSFIHALKTFKSNQGLAQTVEIVCIILYDSDNV